MFALIHAAKDSPNAVAQASATSQGKTKMPSMTNSTAATVASSVQEPLVLIAQMMPNAVRTWNATEMSPVIAAPSPRPRVTRLPFSATSSGLGGGTMTMGAGTAGTYATGIPAAGP